MSLNQIIELYNRLISACESHNQIGQLYFYNCKESLVDSIIKNKRLPLFVACYEETTTAAIIITVNNRGSIDGVLYGKTTDSNKCPVIKRIWSMMSDDEYLRLVSSIYKYIEVPKISNPSFSKIELLIKETSIADEYEFEQALSFRE